MIRAFYEGSFIEKTTIELDKNEHHHVFRVLRARKREPLDLLNGRGKIAKSHIIENEKIFIDQVLEFPPSSIELCPALLKKKAMEWVIREATAIGIRAITPLQTDHCEVKFYDDKEKFAHWEMIAREACKQSGNPWLPTFSKPRKLPEFFEKKDSSETVSSVFVASLQNDVQPIFFYKQAILANESLSLFIGPEGDFSQNEYDYLREQGVHFVSLGKYVLRSETAALYLLSVIDQIRKSKNECL